MLAALASRLAQAVLVMLAVTAIAFVMFRFVGDPVAVMSREDATPAEKAELRHALGLDRSLPVQFVAFVGRVASGDLGMSFRNQRPVATLMAERLPATLELVIVATILSLSVGIPIGVFCALHPEGRLARLIQTASLVGISMPTFVTGIALILVFSVILRWLPSFGRGDVVHLGFWTTGFLTRTGWESLILPSVTLALYQLTLIMRLVRAEMIDVTVTGLQIGSLIAFAIVTETVFQWPGMGLLFIQAVGFADVPVMAAYLLFVGFMFVAINMVVDITYTLIDPRLRTART
jgi:peptide/nickel transport system permease protein